MLNVFREESGCLIMFKYKMKLKRDREGAILVFVVILFLIVSIIASSVAFVFSSNLKMAKHQEENLEGHYLALAGIDITISTLLSPLYVEGVDDKTIVDKLRKDKAAVTMTDEIDIDGQKVGITLVYDNVEEEIFITSTAQVNPDFTKELSVRMQFTESQYRLKWD